MLIYERGLGTEPTKHLFKNRSARKGVASIGGDSSPLISAASTLQRLQGFEAGLQVLAAVSVQSVLQIGAKVGLSASFYIVDPGD